MTPQERKLVTELFERLASLEAVPRDSDAENAIADGLARAPHAIYPLVQTVLLQDEALRRADARIRDLEGGANAQQAGGFLDNMRSALFPARTSGTSVPSVSAGPSGDSRWGSGAPAAAAAPNAAPSQGGSFLGTAAASAAGVIGGAMLYNSISSMFGSQRGHAFAGEAPADRSPWGSDASGSDLAREAGLGDISRGHGPGDERRASLFDETDQTTFADGGDDFGGDIGGDIGGDA